MKLDGEQILKLISEKGISTSDIFELEVVEDKEDYKLIDLSVDVEGGRDFYDFSICKGLQGIIAYIENRLKYYHREGSFFDIPLWLENRVSIDYRELAIDFCFKRCKYPPKAFEQLQRNLDASSTHKIDGTEYIVIMG